MRLRAWYIIVVEHAASTRVNTVIDSRFVDRSYTALEAESAYTYHDNDKSLKAQ